MGNFIPQVWAAALLENLRPAHVYANVVNRDYEGDIKAYGDTVRINNIGGVTISDYTKNTLNLTPELLDGAGQVLTINQGKYFYFYLDDVDKAQQRPQIMEAAMREAAWGIADKTDSFLATTIAGAVATANQLDGGATRIVGTGAGDSDAYETLVDLRKALDLANVPANDRWCVIDPNFLAVLMKDVRFTSFGTSQNLDFVRNGPGTNNLGDTTPNVGAGVEGPGAGMLSKMVGMQVYVSNNVPVTGTTYTILAGYKGAATFAESIAEGSPEAYRLQTGFGDAVRSLHVYGATVARPNALSLVYTQYS